MHPVTFDVVGMLSQHPLDEVLAVVDSHVLIISRQFGNTRIGSSLAYVTLQFILPCGIEI